MPGAFPGEGSNGKPPRGGLCERTPQLWAKWFRDLWQTQGYPVDSPPDWCLRVQGKILRWAQVRRGFGAEWAFVCPECGRRVLVVYILGERVGCRKCLRLVYYSQARRDSIWLVLERAWQVYPEYRRDRVPEFLAGMAQQLANHLQGEITALFRRCEVVRGEEIGGLPADWRL